MIVWISPVGQIVRFVRTFSYLVFRTTFASDGTLWTVGRKYGPDSKDEPSYDLVHHYHGNGMLIGTALSRDTFAAGALNPAYISLMTASPNRTGLYCITANEWIELSYSGEILGRCSLPAQDPDYRTMVTGIALTSSGDLFVSLQQAPLSAPARLAKGPSDRLAPRLRLQRAEHSFRSRATVTVE